jgi:hypothetical protein
VGEEVSVDGESEDAAAAAKLARKELMSSTFDLDMVGRRMTDSPPDMILLVGISVMIEPKDREILTHEVERMNFILSD